MRGHHLPPPKIPYASEDKGQRGNQQYLSSEPKLQKRDSLSSPFILIARRNQGRREQIPRAKIGTAACECTTLHLPE